MELSHMVLRRSADYITEAIPLFDITPVPDLTKMFESAEGPRLFPTHLPANFLPQKIIENKVRIVHIYRNPKDVAVSFFTFIKKLKMFEGYKNAQWKNFISHFMDGEVPSGDWFSHLKDWTDFKKENLDYPILFLSYEDMKEVNIKDYAICSYTPKFGKSLKEVCFN
ncbi:hypothetical protein FSP39_016933 [Pinctada imbricata]|uniref:Sulfotransferase domain-containing protein n=1 Tax=Pinctada imbricata TaxID=66713 RepID=A0AA88XZF3_PINIB|nr:hypothetical protein FSP39_016933 [Pinctada imbricata]